MTGLASVSAVIPCFRCALTIERAVASVAAQTLLPAELILVDDASGDDTRAVLTKLSEKFPPGWIKLVLLDQNVGVGSARNAGWAVASQNFVTFLDADDAWHPQKIEIQYAYMITHSEVALCGHGFRTLKQGQVPDWDAVIGEVQTIGKWAMLVSNRFVTPSVMLKRELAYRFVEKQRHMEDHMLWMQVVCSGANVVKLTHELAAIYKNAFGVTGLSSQVWLMERSDLSNFHRLYKERFLNRLELAFLISFSLLKHVRRMVIYLGYLKWTK